MLHCCRFFLCIDYSPISRFLHASTQYRVIKSGGVLPDFVGARWRGGVRRVVPLFRHEDLEDFVGACRGGRIDPVDDEAHKYLCLAAMNSVGPAVCMKLIEAGANPTRTDSLYGRTALHWAILMEADELKSVVQVLLGRERSTGTASAIRVNVNEVDHDPGLGATALHYAIETQAEDSVIDELLKAGVDSALPNKDGRTALHLTATKGIFLEVQSLHGVKTKRLRPDVVALLLENNPDLCNVSDDTGTLPVLPMHLAAQCTFWRKGGGQIDASNAAAKSEHKAAVGIITLLVAAGAKKYEFEANEELKTEEIEEVYGVLLKPTGLSTAAQKICQSFLEG